MYRLSRSAERRSAFAKQKKMVINPDLELVLSEEEGQDETGQPAKL
jgi:hypothetical protein